MLQIAAVQNTVDVAADSSTGSAGNAPAQGFLALFAKTLSGKAGDPSLLAVQPATGETSQDAGQPAADDPSLLSLLQSLGLPALMPAMTTAVDPQVKADIDSVAVADAGAVQGRNLPSRTATLADLVQARGEGDGQASGQGKDAVLADAVMTKAVLSASHSAKVDAGSAVADSPLSLDGQIRFQSVHAQMTATGQVQNAPQPVADRTVMTMQSTFGSAGWQQELGDKMVWMASGRGHVSDLVLTPPSLGTVEVRLHLNGAEAGAQFYAANADVRNALEQALPRLREMMANAGIVLGDAMVSDQSLAQRDASASRQGSGGARGDGVGQADGGGAVDGVSLAAARSRLPNGLLDYYA